MGSGGIILTNLMKNLKGPMGYMNVLRLNYIIMDKKRCMMIWFGRIGIDECFFLTREVPVDLMSADVH